MYDSYERKYEIFEKIGEGTLATIYRAENIFTKESVACKFFRHEKLRLKDRISIHQEVDIMKSLEHPNLVNFLDFYENSTGCYLFMEYVPGGDLFDRMYKKMFYYEDEARNLVYNLLIGVKYCHDNGICHRDLKPENLLLSGSKDVDIKIGDFGIASKVCGNNLTLQCGSLNFMAPEILNNQNYGKPVDMWSVGVITYILLVGYPPFQDDSFGRIPSKIKHAKYEFHQDDWRAISELAKEFIRNILILDPRSRFTVNDALAHSWISERRTSLFSDDDHLLMSSVGDKSEDTKCGNRQYGFLEDEIALGKESLISTRTKASLSTENKRERSSLSRFFGEYKSSKK